MTLSVLIPAAGFSRRMLGSDKLLECLDGEPILRRQARLALALGGAVRVTVPVGGYEAGRRAVLAGLAVETVALAEAAQGMAASLRQGADLPVGGVMILLPDMPGIGAGELAMVVRAFRQHPDRVIRGAAEGRPGHPVILPARLQSHLGALAGDQGAKDLIRHEVPLLVNLPGDAALLDLDNPQDWAAWRLRAVQDRR